ncbi:Uncharacterised protein [Achromobacter sp. 2789STDY5608615]|jgi:hypothetical protein|uniref:phage adaptor protein n=1 Tax=Achromobacter sp. 2789STDY5608615 TaxID=1806492 RepID=UPI0006C21DFC|nr:hypothetical protein [Achromobacter sp. 2789STDY5608615]CUJ82126.1 Uncharacterised protein [Achromobacter sp. 2789STDY5608615]
MAALADFERFVAPLIEGAPAPAIEDAIVDAAVEFCTRTRVLRAFLDPVTLVPGATEYELDPPEADTQIVDVLAAWLPEGKVDSATRAELEEMFSDGWAWRQVGTTAEVRRFYSRLPGFVQLVPAVTVKVPRALRLEVAYAPTRAVRELPDVLLNRYAEQLASGALGRLHQHKAGYADPGRAAGYLQEFDQACTDLADDGARGFAKRRMRTGGDEFK